MTLDRFISFSMNTSITVDQAFIDEAPYACVAKVIPVLSLHCPIALLGDDKQLPPICENEDDAVIKSYWAKGAIYLEDIFRYGRNFESIISLHEPKQEITKKSELKLSYRFGGQLADLLDRHIYKFGLKGNGDTLIEVYNCQPNQRGTFKKRENHSEMEQSIILVKKYIQKYSILNDNDGNPNIAILTPYKNQVKIILEKIRENGLLADVEVLNTHKAQGREWDLVIFSVVDTGVSGNRPWFTDTNIPEGRAVVNTTISRAKKHLIFLLDKEYWSNRKGNTCLIGDIARNL